MNLILFGTSACHLCEQAEEMLTALLPQFPQLNVTFVDIAEETQWQQRYAIKIPVLYNPENQSELSWVFNTNDVITFINELKND